MDIYFHDICHMFLARTLHETCRKRSTFKVTHWLDMLMKSKWDMTSWQMLRLDWSTNGESPWNLNLVFQEEVLNISNILYFREINIWWFLSEFIKLSTWNFRLMHIVWLQSVSMKCLHHVYKPAGHHDQLIG